MAIYCNLFNCSGILSHKEKPMEMCTVYTTYLDSLIIGNSFAFVSTNIRKCFENLSSALQEKDLGFYFSLSSQKRFE